MYTVDGLTKYLQKSANKFGWKFHSLSKIVPWRSMSIATQNNRDLHQAIFHLWSKFGDPSLNE